MNQRPLPLQTLRAFAAAARTLSFTLAAKELNLSQSAISQQIKLLEDNLSVKLFTRLTRKLELTKEGHFFYVKVIESISQLDSSANELLNYKSRSELIIVATASINTQWLIDKLYLFRNSFPHINISVFEGNSPDDMKKYNADIGLFYGTGKWLEYEVIKVYQDVFFPVCTSKYMKHNKIEVVADLAKKQLLGDADNEFNHWDDWFSIAKIQPKINDSKINYDNMSHMISAAKQGQGIALVRDFLVKKELEQSTLVRLFDIEYTPLHATFLLKNNKGKKKELITSFESWLLKWF